MKALVIWESVTGTTRKAAGHIAAGLRANGFEVTTCPARRVDHGALSEAELVVVGSWTDGLVFVGQKPGRRTRLQQLPFMTSKQAYVFCTYAVDAGRALEKLADIVEARGASVLGGRIVSRFHVPRDCAEIVADIVARVPAR